MNYTKSDSNLIHFLQTVIGDIENNKLSPNQILYLSQFYINYNTTSVNNNTDSNITIFDLLTAGSLFYSTLCNSLNIEYKIKDEEENIN
jgi:hypothetical protein